MGENCFHVGNRLDGEKRVTKEAGVNGVSNREAWFLAGWHLI